MTRGLIICHAEWINDGRLWCSVCRAPSWTTPFRQRRPAPRDGPNFGVMPRASVTVDVGDPEGVALLMREHYVPAAHVN